MKQSHKTLLLWLLLIGMMVGIYSLTGGAEVAGDRLFIIAVVVVVIVVAAILLGRRAQRGIVQNDRGVKLMRRGLHAAALGEFSAARKVNDRDLFRYNEAVAQLHLFRLEEARVQLEALVRKRNLEPSVGPMAQQQLLALRALTGRETPADRVLVATDDDPFFVALKVIHQVRSRAFTEAEETLSRPEPKQLGGLYRALMDALAAWCAFELRGERRPIDRVALFGEAAPDGLYAAWPELEAFLERRD